jgi:hypothetical protein
VWMTRRALSILPTLAELEARRKRDSAANSSTTAAGTNLGVRSRRTSRTAVSEVSGDRYSSAWHADEWGRRGFRYVESAMTKSELYLACLPLILSDRCRLIDSPTLRGQFSRLERRVHSSGRESVDDSGAASAHDDLANATAGVLVKLA